MAALLTNVTGLEVRIKFLTPNKPRYINNLYVPDDATTTWSLSNVMTAVVDESGWVSALADAMNEEYIIDSIQGRVRGRIDAGDEDTRGVGQVGLKVGDPTPGWLTYNVWQIPDNANRLIVDGAPTLFKRGRIAFCGLTDTDINGQYLDPTAEGLFEAAGVAMLSIPAVVGAFASPAFSLVMTRHRKSMAGPPYTYTLEAKANVLGVVGGKVGTQLTAR